MEILRSRGQVGTCALILFSENSVTATFPFIHRGIRPMTTARAGESWVSGSRMCYKIGRPDIPAEPMRMGAAAASRIGRACRAAHPER
jgi:hypothetical protein